MPDAYPCFFVQTGAGHCNISHGHVVNRLLRLRYTPLLLQAEEHYERTHYPAPELWRTRTGEGTQSEQNRNAHFISTELHRDHSDLTDLPAVLKCVAGEVAEHVQGLVVVVQLQHCFLINSLHIFFRLQLHYGLHVERAQTNSWLICSDILHAAVIQQGWV